jgi:hypothetical protein
MSDMPANIEQNIQPSHMPVSNEAPEASGTTNGQAIVSAGSEQSASDLTITKEAYDALLNKVRSDEKSKNRKALDSAKSRQEELSQVLEERNAKLEAMQKKIQTLEDSGLSESDRVLKRLQELEAENATVKEQLELVASSAAERIHLSELTSYKDRLLREKKVALVELVGGNTREEIDISLQRAIQQEEAIRQAERVKLEAEFQSRQVASVPRPMNPTAESRKIGGYSSTARRDIAKRKGADYIQIRDKLLAEAATKSGLK